MKIRHFHFHGFSHRHLIFENSTQNGFYWYVILFCFLKTYKSFNCVDQAKFSFRLNWTAQSHQWLFTHISRCHFIHTDIYGYISMATGVLMKSHPQWEMIHKLFSTDMRGTRMVITLLSLFIAFYSSLIVQILFTPFIINMYQH